MKIKIMLTMMAVGIAAFMSACGSVGQTPGFDLNPLPPPVQEGVLSDEEYAVYSDIISIQTKSLLEMYQKYPIMGMSEIKASELQYAMYHAVSAVSADWLIERLEKADVDIEIINDLLAKTDADTDGSHLNPEIAPEIVLITDEILAGLTASKNPDGFWSDFYAKFPMADGYNSFSRVGFSPIKDKALLIVNQYCGGLCGIGYWGLFEKKDGHWVLVKSEMLWIS